MKNMMLKAAIAGTAATLGFMAITPDAAQAGITFGLGGSNDRESSFTITEDGIDLEITGSTAFGARDVVRRSDGMGVWSGSKLDDKEIDGFGPNETLNLMFSHTVDLISATFSRVGFNDDFTLFVDGSKVVSADIPAPGFTANLKDKATGTFDFFEFDTIGNGFGFSVKNANDDYFLKAVKVTKVAEAIPEPALMLGLGSVAAAGLLAQKRSRKEAA